MLQISDASGGSPRREDSRALQGKTDGEGSMQDLEQTSQEVPEDAPALEREAVAQEEPPPPLDDAAGLALPAVRESFEEGSSAGQTLYDRCALRVASIMRGYLSIREGGFSRQPSAPPGAGHCGAMMEVVLKERGKWAVSKLVAEHNHVLLAASQEPVRGGKDAILPPAVGMEFETIDAAKAFYYAHGVNSGFKARMGSNRRSAGSGALIMQRFLCWRGNYLMYRKGSDAGVRKRKHRGPYRKRPHGLAGKISSASAGKAKNDADAANVVQVQRSMEKGAASEEQQSGELQCSRSVKEAAAPVEEVVMSKAVSSTVDSNIAATNASKSSGKINLVTNSSQSRLLRELGVRVSRYTEEERREIILKYMLKRTKQNSERPSKIPSRQAWAERCERGIGGRFLRRDEPSTSNTHDTITLTEPDAPIGDAIDSRGEPKVGMMFVNEDKAYEFYVKYAGTIGFSVRKGWWDKSARNVTRSRVYVCSREGFRPNNTTNEAKKPRLETRTGCPARMAIKLMPSGNYCVNEFVSEHNHQLAAPLDLQMLRSQRLRTKFQPVMRQSAIQIPAGYKNYIRSKRMKSIQVGDASALLQYFQKMKVEKPSFFYAIQVDQDDQLTNFFWADPKSVMDYHFFGDVICLDTSHKVNDYGRPLVLFTGINHHRQMIIYGAAMLYDETVESFKWLFETFKSAMSGRQPKTLLTDIITGIDDAISNVYPGTVHRPCVWHIYQNAKRHLSHVFEGFEDFALDFAKCIYDCEEEEEFLYLWEKMLEKYDLESDEWLAKLYKEKENWALVYGRNIFCGDIFHTLQNENFHSQLQDFLKPDRDLLSFFKKFEKLQEERHYAECLADYHANQGISGIPPLQLLWQAANAYTPSAFELFRLEFDFSMNCLVYTRSEVGTIAKYEVTIKEKTKAHFVTFDSSDDTIVCSCKKFDFVGIPCCHLLKVIDQRNIKELPPHYILKRWGKDAKAGSVGGFLGISFDDDQKSSFQNRYSLLCRILYNIAAKAAENVEAYEFLESQSDHLLEQVESILCAKLHEKPAASTVSKVQDNVAQNGDNNNESQRLGGKKKNGDSRRKHQKGMDSNIHQKGKKDVGPSADLELPLVGEEAPVPNNIPDHATNPSEFFAPSQLMQGSFGPGHQFALSGIQGFPVITHFTQMQESTAIALHQQPFHSSSQLNPSVVQAASDVNSLQFVEGNPQIEHQSTDQSHYTIPVWDFL